MSIAQHAKGILAAWNVADPARFEMELDSALHCCQRRAGIDMLEMEQQELLETVVERLRSDNKRIGHFKASSSPHTVSAGLALLHHLSHRAAA